MSRPGIFGPPRDWPAQDLIGLSDELDPDLVVLAYRCGVFPMPLHNSWFPARMGWWSPVRRGVLLPDGVRVTRSLRQSAKRYLTTVDAAFGTVLARCADPRRPHGWIDDDIVDAFTVLHERGVVHSVETWTPDGRLAGGLYGVSIGGLFAGESMFHDPLIGRDASKVALLRLVRAMQRDGVGERLIDVQWRTPHLGSLGVIEIDREEYLSALDETLALPGPDWAAERALTERGAPAWGREDSGA
ncbi:MAG TPA: leucyl/phenylalanyl-tRNA--protein transferase [Micropruina sp.]|nr:leucyl/phenylalanyl-tRNA--protein transferase [Micropruina sp.]